MGLLKTNKLLRLLSILIVLVLTYSLAQEVQLTNSNPTSPTQAELSSPNLPNINTRNLDKLDTAYTPLFPKAAPAPKKIIRKRGPVKQAVSSKPWKLLGTINKKAASIQVNPGQVQVWRLGAELDGCILTKVLARSIEYKCGSKKFELN